MLPFLKKIPLVLLGSLLFTVGITVLVMYNIESGSFWLRTLVSVSVFSASFLGVYTLASVVTETLKF